MTEPPQILRIKRKRGQDPLQALVLEERRLAKRSKPLSPVSSKPLTPTPEAKNYYFELTRTDNANVPDPDVLASVLSEAVSQQENRQFVIPKQQTEEDIVIPNELSEMLDTFLHVDGGNTTRRKRTRRGGSTQLDMGQLEEQPRLEQEQQEDENDELDDYVFDVYKLSSTTPLTNANYPLSLIGYIRFFDDDEYDLMQSDDETKGKGDIYSDDEDSNAESFYQNDYPEDEDAGEFSDTYDVLPEDDDEDENIGPVILDSAEGFEGNAYLQGHIQADQADQSQFDALYDDFFDENGERKMDFLGQDGDAENEEDFERQQFFVGEEDNELAQHRDRIFGRLQKMIDEN